MIRCPDIFWNCVKEIYVFVNESNFLSSFVSGLLIVLISTFFIPWYLDWRKKPRLELYFNKLEEDKVYSKSITVDLSQPVEFTLSIKNSGLREYSGFYWSLFLPENFSINFKPINSQIPKKRSVIGAPYLRIGGFYDKPIFPYRINEFSPEILGFEVPRKKGTYKFYYYFSTPFGLSPDRAKKIDPESHPSKISDKFKYMDCLEINIV